MATRKKSSSCIGIVLAVVFALGVGIQLYFNWAKITLVQVTGFAWERSIVIEDYKTVRVKGWEIPPNGRYVGQQTAVHHYDHIVDHYETRSHQVPEESCVPFPGILLLCTTTYRLVTENVPVNRDIPVFQTEYTYDIETWVYNRTQATSGKDHMAYWPEISLASNEQERGSWRLEGYTVYFVGLNGETDHPLRHTCNYDEWLSYSSGAWYVAETSSGVVWEIKSK